MESREGARERTRPSFAPVFEACEEGEFGQIRIKFIVECLLKSNRDDFSLPEGCCADSGAEGGGERTPASSHSFLLIHFLPFSTDFLTRISSIFSRWISSSPASLNSKTRLASKPPLSLSLTQRPPPSPPRTNDKHPPSQVSPQRSKPSRGSPRIRSSSSESSRRVQSLEVIGFGRVEGKEGRRWKEAGCGLSFVASLPLLSFSPSSKLTYPITWPWSSSS